MSQLQCPGWAWEWERRTSVHHQTWESSGLCAQRCENLSLALSGTLCYVLLGKNMALALLETCFCKTVISLAGFSPPSPPGVFIPHRSALHRAFRKSNLPVWSEDKDLPAECKEAVPHSFCHGKEERPLALQQLSGNLARHSSGNSSGIGFTRIASLGREALAFVPNPGCFRTEGSSV